MICKSRISQAGSYTYLAVGVILPKLQLLLEEQQARDEEKLEQQKNNAELAQKRLTLIDAIIRKLLEQNAAGVISDERFAAMMKEYETEQESLKQTIAEFEKAKETLRNGGECGKAY